MYALSMYFVVLFTHKAHIHNVCTPNYQYVLISPLISTTWYPKLLR